MSGETARRRIRVFQVATGNVGVYPQRGKYQLYVKRLDPHGQGALELAFRDERQPFDMAAYSAKKKNDQRRPEYSVWKPATSSDSDSGRSKGARLLAARLAMKKTKNAAKANGSR